MCHHYEIIIMVILLVKLTDVFCLVPYTVVSHRLSILYPRTCVGLGYGIILYIVMILNCTL